MRPRKIESFVPSADGTRIAFSATGAGPAVILVDGALCYRGMGPGDALARCLADGFTVFQYDRRGRGKSGDTAPYAVQREIEDLGAVLKAAGGTAMLWGTSSGAVLALDAAAQLPGVAKVAVYEAPLIADGSRPTTEKDWLAIRQAVARGDRSQAVRQFLRSVGLPGLAVAMMRLLPMWPRLKAVAHTIPYDGELVADLQRGKPPDAARWAGVAVPVLVADGGRSPQWMRNGNAALAAALPNASYRTVAGLTHNLKAPVLAPVLASFFAAPG
ncbi:alpha/beta hydrolase [Ramlibacter sp.]|uniref:alpha/beta fold hydrolase n=1 Tax=Ramlibacter sp. TaxID=1917967 RepID=UPI0017EBD612|nr:alpha/beta hydrolase [Ramlibacter sp.]MBA2676766.1 alpha/beta hydrolase [Ramlibacter sp.]